MVAASALILGVAACSGDGGIDDPGTGDESAGPDDAALDLAECMREQGIEMPDPQIDDNSETRIEFGEGVDADELEAALDACGGLPGTEGDTPFEHEQSPDRQQAMLDWAECMRGQGIEMPDPGPEGSAPPVVDPDVPEERMAAAIAACDPILRGGVDGEHSSGDGGQSG